MTITNTTTVATANTSSIEPTTTATLEQLVQIGGKLWERNGVRRVYFNELYELFDLQLNWYKTGNVFQAWLHGERISNCYAKKIIGDLNNIKLWIDLTDLSIRTRVEYRLTLDYNYEQILATALLERLSAK